MVVRVDVVDCWVAHFQHVDQGCFVQRDTLFLRNHGEDFQKVLLVRAVNFDLEEDTLFRTAITLPANLTEGTYEARIFLTRNGRVIDEYTAEIPVHKVGLERWLYNLSRENPMLYGIMSLTIAIAAGWGASAAFRLLRQG